MRTTFHQFFRLTKHELDEILEHALICYDANVLLNVYRYSDETQKGLVDVIKAFANRTYLPHQVAYEYAKNRAKTIVDQIKLCQDTESAFRKVIKDYIDPKDKQPFLSSNATNFLDQIMEELTSKKKILESMISNDPYADLLLTLFDKKIGSAPDADTLNELREQASRRYANKIPPGYSDLKDKQAQNSYGDYIVWRQLMDMAKEKECDFIFITDDSKEDWRLRIGGKTIGPRPELLEEFRRETGQRVCLFTSEGFLIATKEAGSTQISDSVIKEVGALLDAETIAPMAEEKLSDQKSSRAALSEDKLTIPGEKVAASAKMKTATVDEDGGGEE